MTRTVLCAVLVGGLAGIAAPGTAFADPAGPTEFRSEIVAVTPSTPSIELSIEGGDSFVHIRVEPGTDVVILGYDGEPATWIDAEGHVYENVRSFATYYNDDRYGRGEIPAIVDNDAPPEWERVGSGGAWSWHDHRAHWMGTEPPIGMEPGDSLDAQAIPLVVDGADVAVEVVSTLQAGPSPWSSIGGLLVGIAMAGIAVVVRRASIAALGLGVAAVAVGGVQYLSLPPETGPSLLWWFAPAVAVVSASAAWWWRRTALFRDGLTVLAAAQLLLWAFDRRLTFVRPVLPTDAPFWLDRAVGAAVAGGAVVLLVAALGSLVELVRQPPASAASIASSSPS
jgi:hypothetical protein